MAKGKLGAMLSVAGTAVTVYTIHPTATSAVVTVDLENLDPGADATVDIYFTTNATPQPVDRIAHAVVGQDGGHFELSCKLMSPNEKIMVVSDTSTVAIRVSGIEEIAA